MNNILSIADQVRLMAQDWPGFRLVVNFSWYVVWEGKLRPLHQSYLIRVTYCLGHRLKNAYIPYFAPRVVVEEPQLTCRTDNPGEPIPHHYPNRSDPQRPILCLYDPREAEWSPSKSITKTTIPWAMTWLACYEGWHATGMWTGGGRHPSAEQTASAI